MTKLFESRPFLIAEIGSNWQTLDQALKSIRVAKECGADAAKFQLFDFPALYGFLDSRHAAPMRMRGELRPEWLKDLKAEADRIGIEFMCTAFSPELVAIVDPFVSIHKVASSDAAWPQMLEAVAKTGKPVLVSTGAKSSRDIAYIGAKIMDLGIQPFFMDCTANYPADFSDFTFYKGFSDHTLGYTVPVLAARAGVPVIEKHFTAFPDLDTPDRPHSLNPKQFKRMVDIIRGREVESEEQAMFLRHNRRLIATHDIQPGQHLRYGVNFGTYRSLEDDTRGASPFDWEKVNGRMAKGPIGRGKAISLEDVE